MVLETKINVPEKYFGFAFGDVSIFQVDIDDSYDYSLVDVTSFKVRLMIDDVFLGDEISIGPHMEDIEQTRGDVHIISELQKIFNA